MQTLRDAALGGVMGGVHRERAQHAPLRHDADARVIEPAHGIRVIGAEHGARVGPLTGEQGGALQRHPLGQHHGVARAHPRTRPRLAVQHPHRRAYHHRARHCAGDLGMAADPGNPGAGRCGRELREQLLQRAAGGARRQQHGGGQVARLRAHRYQVIAVDRHRVAADRAAGQGNRITGHYQARRAGNDRRVLAERGADVHVGSYRAAGREQRGQQLGVDLAFRQRLFRRPPASAQAVHDPNGGTNRGRGNPARGREASG